MPTEQTQTATATETVDPILTAVKHAMRITVEAYDDELTELIEAAKDDLGLVGVPASTMTNDHLVIRAITTYCRTNFGSPDDYDRLKASYDEQKSQLISATGYGLW